MTGRTRAGILVFASLVLAAGGFAWHEVHGLDAPVAVASPLRFKVAPGSRISRVAHELALRGVLRRTWVWVAYARWTRVAAGIKAGEYEIDPGDTPRSLLAKMVAGQVVLHSFTIVDGWRVSDLLAGLRQNPDVRFTLPLNDAGVPEEAGLMDKLGSPGTPAEGQFLPETYRFPSGTADLEILRQAHAALARELAAAWAGRALPTPLSSAAELLVLASIVEKESGVASELPRIAGLYLNRLRIGMRLQADPTVIYGLGRAYDGEIHGVDLRTDGPYNTYTRAGLPPTPIALAGAAVIRATARPESTDALYFVASPTGDGSHVFSATLDQHRIAVAEYVARHRQAR